MIAGPDATDESTSESLGQIAKGTITVLSGTLVGMLTALCARLITARCLTQSEFGILSLSLVILGLCLPVSLLGLQEGAARYIGYFAGKNDKGKVRGVICSSLGLTAASGVGVAILLFAAARVIAERVYGMPGLTSPLRILVLNVPLHTTVTMLVAVFRGFGIVKVRVYFVNLVQGAVLVTLLLATALLGWPLEAAAAAYVASNLVTLLALVSYSRLRIPVELKSRYIEWGVARQVLMFSMPVFASTIVNVAQTQMSPLILGLLGNPELVGLYAAAWPLAQYLSLVLTAMGFIYVPAVARLKAKGLDREIEVGYQRSTKWLFLLSVPLFFVLLSQPRLLLGALFGAGYSDAAVALQIMAVGYLFHTSLGANGMTLLAIGRSRVLLVGSVVGAVTGLLSSVALVPRFWLEGAAVAAVLSFVGMNVVNSTALYHSSGVHPFTSDYVKVLVVSCTSFVAYGVVASRLPPSLATPWIAVPAFGIIWLLCLVAARAFTVDDRALVSTVARDAWHGGQRVRRMMRMGW